MLSVGDKVSLVMDIETDGNGGPVMPKGLKGVITGVFVGRSIEFTYPYDVEFQDMPTGLDFTLLSMRADEIALDA